MSTARRNIVKAVLFIILILISVPVFCEPAYVITAPGIKTVSMIESLMTPNEDLTNLLKFSITQPLGGSTAVSMPGDVDFSYVGSIIDTMSGFVRGISTALLIASFCIGLAQAFINNTAYEEITIKRLIIFGMLIVAINVSQPVCGELNNIGIAVTDKIATATTTQNGQDLFSEASASIDGKPVKTKEGDDFVYSKSSVSSIAEYQQRVIEGSSYSVDHSGEGVLGALAPNGIQDAVNNLTTTVNSFFRYETNVAPSYYISRAAGIITKVTCWGRAIELMVLVCFAPIAFIGIGHDPVEAAIRFFKSYFAVVLQGCIILIVTKIVNALNLSILAAPPAESVADALPGMINIAVLAIVQAAMAARSRQIAQTICGT